MLCNIRRCVEMIHILTHTICYFSNVPLTNFEWCFFGSRKTKTHIKYHTKKKQQKTFELSRLKHHIKNNYEMYLPNINMIKCVQISLCTYVCKYKISITANKYQSGLL